MTGTVGTRRPTGFRLQPVLRRLRSDARVVGALACATAGLLGAALGGPAAAAAGVAYAAFGVRAALRRRRARADAAHREAVVDALNGLAAQLRAGAPSAALEPVVDRLYHDERVGSLVAAVWRLAERTGAPVADLLDRVEADQRSMDRAAASAAAQAAGAKATSWLLAGLPAAGIALGYGMGADPLRVLTRTPLGVGCLSAAILLQLAGLVWTDRIIRLGPPATGSGHADAPPAPGLPAGVVS